MSKKRKKPECVEYLEQVRDGKIVASRRVGQLAGIMLDRIENGYKCWHFDYTLANRPCEFIETFCMLPSGKLGTPFELEPFQRCWVQVMFGFVDDRGIRQFQEVLWVIGRKNGKALSLDTQIPTPDGYKAMRDIHPGDYVFGVDGKPSKVLIESKVFHKPMYAVTFEDGETIKASEDHIWTVQNKKMRSKDAGCGKPLATIHGHPISDKRTADLTTKELAERVFYERADGKGREYLWRVPMNSAVEYAERNLPIDPYLLGCWLGDGNSRDNQICVGLDDFEEVMELLGDFSPKPRKRKTSYMIRVGDKFTDEHGYMHNTVKDELASLGLLGNKHIPEAYLHASIEQRLALLQGLMDTDGTIEKNGQCSFSQKGDRMLDGMTELLSGLGIKNSHRKKFVKCNGKTFETYVISFYTDKSLPCFRLKRKFDRLKDKLAPRMSFKSIVNIEQILGEPSKCIAVDSPDHLFLCGRHYTATHNSSLGAALELYMLTSDGEGAPQVYNVATSKDQASLAYGAAVKMMRQSKALSKHLRKGTVTERDQDGIICDSNFGYITPLTSQTRHLDGLDVHFCLFDELAACTNRDQYDLVRQGMAAETREQPMMLCITTNGFERGNIFDDRYEYGCRILDGEVDDDRFLPIIYELDDREEWTDEPCWAKANPGLGTIKKVSALRDIVNEALQNPGILPTVLTKDFNIPENRAASWLSREECVNEEAFDVREMGFRYGIAGFDASDTTDLSAATMLMMRPGDERIYELSMYWIPEASLADDGRRTERDDVPFRLWESRGLLRIVPGNKVPKHVFLDWLEEVKEEYDIWTYAVGFDPWRIVGTDAEMLEQYVGKENCEVVRQGAQTLSDPMKQLRADLRDHRIVNNHNPIDEWCRANVAVKADDNMNLRPVKSERKSKRRIDGFMSELDAYVALLRHQEDYASLI